MFSGPAATIAIATLAALCSTAVIAQETAPEQHWGALQRFRDIPEGLSLVVFRRGIINRMVVRMVSARTRMRANAVGTLGDERWRVPCLVSGVALSASVIYVFLKKNECQPDSGNQHLAASR